MEEVELKGNSDRPLMVPKWILRRLKLFWDTFKDKEFTYEEATKELEGDDERMIAQALSRLNRAGWIEVRKEWKDGRAKSFYKIANPEITKAIIKIKV
jgi:predicted transcriptional regulator